MERLIQVLDAVSGLLDRVLPANRGFRRSIGFATLWLVVTGVVYLIPGTRYSPESDSHTAGHLNRSAFVAALMTLMASLCSSGRTRMNRLCVRD
jgi:hypothetical protein